MEKLHTVTIRRGGVGNSTPTRTLSFSLSYLMGSFLVVDRKIRSKRGCAVDETRGVVVS